MRLAEILAASTAAGHGATTLPPDTTTSQQTPTATTSDFASTNTALSGTTTASLAPREVPYDPPAGAHDIHGVLLLRPENHTTIFVDRPTYTYSLPNGASHVLSPETTITNADGGKTHVHYEWASPSGASESNKAGLGALVGAGVAAGAGVFAANMM